MQVILISRKDEPLHDIVWPPSNRTGVEGVAIQAVLAIWPLWAQHVGLDPAEFGHQQPLLHGEFRDGGATMENEYGTAIAVRPLPHR